MTWLSGCPLPSSDWWLALCSLLSDWQSKPSCSEWGKMIGNNYCCYYLNLQTWQQVRRVFFLRHDEYTSWRQLQTFYSWHAWERYFLTRVNLKDCEGLIQVSMQKDILIQGLYQQRCMWDGKQILVNDDESRQYGTCVAEEFPKERSNLVPVGKRKEICTSPGTPSPWYFSRKISRAFRKAYKVSQLGESSNPPITTTTYCCSLAFCSPLFIL